MNKEQREKLLNLVIFKCYITNKQRDAILPWVMVVVIILFVLLIITKL
jgi:hypothetical protein